MIQSQFKCFEGLETLRFSGTHFCFGIYSFDDALQKTFLTWNAFRRFLLFLIVIGSSTKDVPFHWPSSPRANGKEGDSRATGISTERRACPERSRRGLPGPCHQATRLAWDWPPRAGAVEREQSLDDAKHKTEKFLVSTHKLFNRASIKSRPEWMRPFKYD